MRSRRMRPVQYFAGLLAIAFGFAALGFRGEAPKEPDAPAPGARQGIPDIAGIWAGTWKDTLYDVTGALSCTIQLNGEAFLADGIIDLSYWSYLGLGDEQGTASGTLAGDQLSFTFQAPTVGSGSGTLTGNQGSGSGSVGPPIDFGSFTFEGWVSAERITGIFDYPDPGGEGRITLYNITASGETSWSAIKARYRDGEP